MAEVALLISSISKGFERSQTGFLVKIQFSI
jgi:hypothetical protein